LYSFCSFAITIYLQLVLFTLAAFNVLQIQFHNHSKYKFKFLLLPGSIELDIAGPNKHNWKFYSQTLSLKKPARAFFLISAVNVLIHNFLFE